MGVGATGSVTSTVFNVHIVEFVEGHDDKSKQRRRRGGWEQGVDMLNPHDP